MTDTATKDDLEFLRDMADAGAHAPLLGGRFLAWWGAIITLAYGAHYLMVTGAMGLQPWMIPIMWVSAIAFALVGYFVLGALYPRDKPGSSSPGNRASVVWRSAGLSIFAFFMGAQWAFHQSDNNYAIFDWSLPLVFAVYGCALMVTGALAKDKFVQGAAWLALVLVAATTARIQSPDVYILAAFGAFACAFVPGLVQMRAEPKSVV
ncbi:MAG: hypothetical protein AAFY10_12520 [Pseudomonadota bacterium]